MRPQARAHRLVAWYALALLPAAALADVRLEGAQHIGNNSEPGQFEPSDPVGCERFAAYPSNFHLSHDVVVTALTLHDAVDLDAPLHPVFDGRRESAACPQCTACDGTEPCGDVMLLLDTPVVLRRGAHTLALTDAVGSGACDADNDYGFAAITLHSGEATLHRSFNQRRHLGDRADDDDDYDLDDDLQLYPDGAEGNAVTLSFALESARRLSEVRLYRVRDLDAPATVSVDGVTVGQINGDGDVIVPANLMLAAGTHQLRIATGILGGNPDDFSWDDVNLLFVADPLMPAGLFNAVDPAQHATSGRIGTKIAGTPFELDLVALGAGALSLGYTGNVMVQLLDASNSTGVLDLSGCDTGWTVVNGAWGSATFTVPDEGRKRITLVHPDALRVARVRVLDTVIGVSGCSADAFAIRPAAFAAIQASHGDSRSPGIAEPLAGGGFSGATPAVHRAGRPFTVRAAAINSLGTAVAGYSGAPSLRAVGSALGSAAGAASASGWSGTGIVRSDNVRYFEAGAARLELIDTTFAEIDAGDSPAAARRIGPTPFEVGRFIPDHFRFTPLAAEFLAGCTGFTYAGQPLAYSITPSAELAAVAFGGAATRNYTDPALYKLPAAIAPSAFSALTGALLYAPSVPDNAVVRQSNGTARLSLLPLPAGALAFERAAPIAPFDAEIAITVGALNEGDGVEIEPPPGRFGNLAPGAGVPFLAGARQVRFGRLVVDNAHGSERLPLAVPLRTEYWAGSGGFAPSTGDSCTTLADSQFTLARSPTSLPTGIAGAPLTIPLANGRGALPLSAPNTGGTAAVRGDLTAALLPWLRGDWDGDGDYNEADGSGDPAARATFGIYKNSEWRIYQREIVR